MARTIQHQMLAPNGQPFLVLSEHRVRSGESIQAFIRRTGQHYDLPTRCFVNGEVIRPQQLTKIRIRVRDEIVIVSRPGMGGSDGKPSTAKTIGSIVAMVALMVLAPYAGGALAAATVGATATIAGVTYSSIFAGFVLAAGGMLISQFMKPKAAQPSSAAKSLYSISASSNQARPLGMIPVGYGKRLRYPEYAAPPYSTFVGDDQFLYQLFSIGCGQYDPATFMLDDTPFWTSSGGMNPAFADIQFQWVAPGEQVTLFPVNITSASEVSGQRLPSPSKDPVRQGYLGPFSISPPGTSTKEIWIDLVWPSGAGQTYKSRELPTETAILVEARQIDDAGAPIGGESAGWVALINKNYSINTKTAYRITEKITVNGGRWQVRAKRKNDAYQDVALDPKIQAHDDVSWTGARALIDGPQSFPGVTLLATVMKADAQTSGGTQNRIGVIAQRKIEVYRAGLWTLAASRNPIDAAIDMWRNADYSAGLSGSNLVLQDLLYQRDACEARGDTFDHFFEDAVSIQEAIETALRVMKGNPAFIGDRLSVVRDEPKSPRMLFTDQEIVRGSLTVKRHLLDDTWADGVVVNYFDERTNRPASAPSAANLVRPARVELPGISKAAQAADCAAYLAAVNRYRRRRVQFQCELEGRMLKRGDLVLIQSELPQTWGEGGEVRSYLLVNGALQITLDRPVTWTAGKAHFIVLRQRNGRPYGPVRVSASVGSVVTLDGPDLAIVDAQQGSIHTLVLQRADTEDPPSYSFSVGSPREYRGLIVSATMRDFVATIDTVIEASEVYSATPGSVPAIPQIPIIFDKGTAPVLVRLSARAFQRGAGLFLSVSWDPAQNAALYLAQVSIDERTSWVEAYRDSRTSFEIPIADVAKAYVRVACITAAGVVCRFLQTQATVPDLVIDGSLIDVSTLPPIDYDGLGEDARTRIENAQETAEKGVETAERGVALAGDALDAAGAALDKAIEGVEDAATAQRAADLAQGAADKAQKGADAAADLAGDALDAAGGALDKALESLGNDAVNAAGIISETNARVTQDNATATRIDGVVAKTETNAAAVLTEQTARTTADSAIAQRIDTVVARTETGIAAVTSEQAARVSADGALGSRIDTVSARTETGIAAVTSEQTARVAADGAAAQRIDTVTARTDGAIAGVTSEQAARSSADGALGQRIDSVVARTDAGVAAVTSEQTARVSADGALGQRVNTVSARVDTSIASVTSEQTARVSADGAAAQRIDAVAARTELGIAGVTSEQSARVSADGALAQRIDTVTAKTDTGLAAVSSEQTARVSADGALGLRIDTVVAKSDGNAAAVISEQTARTSADGALGQRIDTVTARTDAGIAGVSSEQTARVSADGALGQRIDTVSARTEAGIAAVTSEQTARVGSDGALGQRIDTVVARTDTAIAGVTSEQTARTTADGAIGQRIDTVIARTDNALAGVTSEQTARTTADNALAQRIDAVVARTDAAIAGVSSEQSARVSAVSAVASRVDTVQAQTDKGTAFGRMTLQARSDVNGVSARFETLLATTVGGQTRGAGYYIDLMPDGKSRFVIDANSFFITANGSTAPTFSFDGQTLTIPSLRVTNSAILPGAVSDTVSNAISDFDCAFTNDWKEVPGTGFTITPDVVWTLLFSGTAILQVTAFGNANNVYTTRLTVAVGVDGQPYSAFASAVATAGGGASNSATNDTPIIAGPALFELLPAGQTRRIALIYTMSGFNGGGKVKFGQLKASITKR